MRHLFVFCLAFLLTTGCAAQNSMQADSGADGQSLRGSLASGVLDPAWYALYDRLCADGLDDENLPDLFVAMGAPSPEPMSRKIRELYTSSFLKKPDPEKESKAAGKDGGKTTAKPKKPEVYQGIVTAENVEKCRAFLSEHEAAFDMGESRYGVPREIAVSLLFVETRLGTFLGRQKAFYTLASMAASRDPEQISETLAALPGAETRTAWVRERMEQRSDWAYKEFVALLQNTRATGADPLEIPGSVYGAIGLCQFMPSNIVPLGADGDDDGVIDLFNVSDAVASLSNYLVRNGWKKGMSRARQHAVLKSYNRVNIYANTILALAEAQGYVAEPGRKAAKK